jgi:23S rRNA (pseudouridine1915-N3)-methyltransferase
MRIHLIAVGRARRAPEMALAQVWLDRLPWPVTIREVEAKRGLTGSELKAAEAKLLLGAVPDAARIIALDEHGRELDSRQFADLIGRWRDAGAGDVACLIGGADGLDDSVRDRADHTLAFGRLTWPHLLCRAMLAEQLYRASTILAGHPYHRD